MAMLVWAALRGPIVARDLASFGASLGGSATAHLTQGPGNAARDIAPAIVGSGASASRDVTKATERMAMDIPPGSVVLDIPAPVPVPVPTPAPAPAVQESDMDALPWLDGARLANQAYQRLRMGDRRTAAALLAAAVETGGGDPRVAAWAADRRLLMRRWSGDAYLLARRGGTPRFPAAATPTLGGSQAGARLAYVLTPLADQRITLSGRIFQPLGRRGGGSEAAQAVVGLELQPSRKLPLMIAVDRYAALGPLARNAWALRVSGGADSVPIGRGLEASLYGQAGIIGLRSRDGYADGWMKVQSPVAASGRIRALVGAGVWAGVQPGASRVDVGPTAEFSARLGRARVAAGVDYRVRAAGNARPGNGPAVTVRAGF